ncbi:hypothetical protein C8F04DRAFT_1258382 [Mycena alexandri]|uniref:Uncharacterized protein n=1 Tax=Mycena alexandri TaxID=1745969 RepID=A0AAD6T036_9AGAR|nr:hypothetical protein C8F04DRAFT_1258382 [Mycena alexandri]
MAIPTSTFTSSSASERARRPTTRSTSAPASDPSPTAPVSAQPALPTVPEGDTTMADVDTNVVADAPAVQTLVRLPPTMRSPSHNTPQPAPTALAAPAPIAAAPAPVAAANVPFAAAPVPVAAAPVPVAAVPAAAASTPIVVGSATLTPALNPVDFPGSPYQCHPSAQPHNPRRTPTSRHLPIKRTRAYLEREQDRTREHENNANLARGIAQSLGYRTDVDNGASSSCHPADLNSPPKRQRADSTGRAVSTGSDPDAEEPAPTARPRRAARPNPYLTVDGNPPQASYAPTPRGGHRTVYGVTADTLLFNLPPRQRGQWDAVPHPKILATVAGGNGDRIMTWEGLRNHIAGRFNMDPEDVSVGTPGLGEHPGADPAAWLIAGLSEEQAQALLDMGALVSDTMTTVFHAYNPQLTGFAATFQGFTISITHAVIADAIMADPAVTRFVRAHRDAVPPFISNDEALARFGESIRVTGIQLLSPRGLFTAWNVYVDSPTYSEEHFAALGRLVGNIVIDTPFNGQGRIYPRPLRCTICGGRDHPTSLCPLPATPGYLGPTPETIGALLEASREALNPKGKKSGCGNAKSGGKGNGNGKGKDRDDRKGSNGRKGGRGE